ncbi:MAG: hypothetical protein KIS97_20990 [Nitrospira sp.]|nr:hypothetical protein [Nitrospira sp.]
MNFSLLPNDMVPLHSYGLQLISDRLRANVNGVGNRNREFYVSQGLFSDEVNDNYKPGARGLSWSDRLSDQPLRPAHQLFAAWRRKWATSAVARLRELLLACMLVGCDLKSQLGKSLEHFADCSPSARSLLLSVGLIALLREETVTEAWPWAILMLGHAPSHKSFRAAGRPPPQYGGHLKFNAD